MGPKKGAEISSDNSELFNEKMNLRDHICTAHGEIES